MSCMLYEDLDVHLKIIWTTDETEELSIDITKYKSMDVNAICVAHPWETLEHLEWRARVALHERLAGQCYYRTCGTPQMIRIEKL